MYVNILHSIVNNKTPRHSSDFSNSHTAPNSGQSMTNSDSEEDGVRVLGVGVGLLLLILIWSCTVAGLVLVSKLGSPLSIIFVAVAGVLTVIFLAVPRTQSMKPG